MRVVFRTDASIQIGTGHVMRCLALAGELSKRGAQCTFVCRPHTGHLLELIRNRGHAVSPLSPGGTYNKALPGQAYAAWLGTTWQMDAHETLQALDGQLLDWLVVDHYSLDRAWERAMRPLAKKILVVDDLADRPHDCDLLLDQNAGRSERDYGGLIEAGTQTLVGPTFALLRPEFAQWRTYSVARRAEPQLKALLISMGGVDQVDVTSQVTEALRSCRLRSDAQISIVMGPYAPWLKRVECEAALMPWRTQVLVGVNNMAQLMAESDLAIGAGGGSAWERCAMGLPSIIFVIAPNQQSGADALQRHGAAIVLQKASQIPEVLNDCLLAEQGTMVLEQMSRSAATLSTGDGAKKVANAMIDGYV